MITGTLRPPTRQSPDGQGTALPVSRLPREICFNQLGMGDAGMLAWPQPGLTGANEWAACTERHRGDREHSPLAHTTIPRWSAYGSCRSVGLLVGCVLTNWAWATQESSRGLSTGRLVQRSSRCALGGIGETPAYRRAGLGKVGWSHEQV